MLELFKLGDNNSSNLHNLSPLKYIIAVLLAATGSEVYVQTDYESGSTIDLLNPALPITQSLF